jgi:hypothetical protein
MPVGSMLLERDRSLQLPASHCRGASVFSAAITNSRDMTQCWGAELLFPSVVPYYLHRWVS